MPASRNLRALRRMLKEAHLILSTTKLPQGRAERAAELLDTALAITDDLIATDPSAVALGQRGGRKTAERGPEYFRKIAAMRKTRAGGRPRATE